MDLKDYIRMMNNHYGMYGGADKRMLEKKFREVVKEMLDKENFIYADTDSIMKTKTHLDVIKEYSVEEMRYFIYKLETTPAIRVEIMKQNEEHCIAQIIKFLESEDKE